MMAGGRVALPLGRTDGDGDDDDDDDDNDRNARRWERLKCWVEDRHGGYVHPGLALVVVGVEEDHDHAEVDQHEGEEDVGCEVEYSRRHTNKKKKKCDRDEEDRAAAQKPPWRPIPSPNRGIVATQSISRGTMLVRIPSGLALGGRCRRHNNWSSGAAAVAAATTTTTSQATVALRRQGGLHFDGEARDRNDDEESNYEPDDAHVAAVPPSKVSGGGSPWLECLMALYAAQREQHRELGLSSNEDESGLGREPPPPPPPPPRQPHPSASPTVAPPRQRPRTWGPYLDSLPAHFDTLLDWTDDELRYLAGTSLQEDHPTREHMRQELRTRYVANVRLRLAERRLVPDRSIDIDDDNELELEFERFAWACQAISTRCFHVANPPFKDRRHPDPSRGDDDHCSNSDDDIDDEGQTTGPYFLPVIDLLNHSNGSDRVTTLTAVPTNAGDDPHRIAYYEMVAERNVEAGEPITHSYGNDLNSAQCLRTFGFVPREATTKVAMAAVAVGAEAEAEAGAGASRSRHLSPAILSKEMVLKCCRRTLEQERNSRVAAHDGSFRMDDEAWELPAPDAVLGRDASSLPDHIAVTETRPLPDDLVTLLSLPFLPDDAYQELVVPEPEPATEFSSAPPPPAALISRLDASVLEDPYLGRLVGQTLLEVVKEKAGTYGAIRIDGLVVLEELDDKSLLQDLLQWEAGSGGSSTPTTARLGAIGARSRQRLMYALTIRLEERSCLEALRRVAVRILVRATDDDDDTEDGEDNVSCGGSDEPRTKRQNTSAYE